MVEILIIKNYIRPSEIKIANLLHKEGYSVGCLSLYPLDNKQKNLFDRNYYLLDKNLAAKEMKRLNKVFKFFILLKNLPKFLSNIMKIKKCISIGVGGFNWFVTFCFLLLGNKSLSKIYFPYDIAYFRYKNYRRYPWFERISEKYNFKNCDGIIHKGPEDELKYLPEEFEAMKKPALQFLPYCDEDSFIPIDDEFFDRKLSKKDGKIHLVYVGGVYHNHPPHFNTIDVFRRIIDQGLHLHVYATNFEKIKKEKDYNELKKTGLFHLHRPIYGEQFHREISKCDWGIYIFYRNFKIKRKIPVDNAFGNKISSYIEAGLPVISNSELEFVSKIIRKFGFGIVIDKPNEIRERIKETDYINLVEKLNKKRDEYTMSNNIPRLLVFIEKPKGFSECSTKRGESK